MEFAGLILIIIGVNTFMNGVWLMLYNAQNSKIKSIEVSINKLIEGDKQDGTKKIS